MSSIQTEPQTPFTETAPGAGELPIEVVVLPVADVDRAKEFYLSLGWRLDGDFVPEPGFRVVQVTPPGSAASIIFGKGVTDSAPGTVARLLLVVPDIDAARDDLVGRGVTATEVFHREGADPKAPGPAVDRTSYGSFVAFSDPDGNGLVLQEITQRLANRSTAPLPGPGEMKLEQVALPVADIDRAKQFYESLGWRLDADFEYAPDARAVQLTPRGSGTSIGLAANGAAGAPGSLQDLVLVTQDIDAARDALVAGGAQVSDVWHDAGGVFYHADTVTRVSGPADGHADYESYVSFSDPDGNGWVVQEIKRRFPGR